MDILDSKGHGISIFKLDISNRQLTVDRFRIQLLGPRKSHLKLPDKLITIAPKYRQTKMSHRSRQNNTMSYYEVVCHDERARYADRGHHNGRGEQEDSPRPSKTTEKSKSKMTFLDIMMEENITSNKKLTKKDYNRPDVIHAKQTELEFFF